MSSPSSPLLLDTNILIWAISAILHRSPWDILPLAAEHLSALVELPTLHKDPFDRLLIAQAKHEGMTIVTADEQTSKYEVRTIW